MPKRDDKPPKVKDFADLLLLGKIRNPEDPLRGLVGARVEMKVNKTWTK